MSLLELFVFLIKASILEFDENTKNNLASVGGMVQVQYTTTVVLRTM